ncbi:MAG: transcriptional regulator AlsR family [Holophagaceae bacterium]|nr:transcriptional regulator AlsR family [Holophagaceae bacterium]
MDIRQLRCFLAAAEHLNFTKAASDLFLTQSGVSYQITSLESSLGVQLFHRSPRAMKLTEAGVFYHRAIRDLVENYDEIVLKTRLLGTEVTGKLSIGVVGGYEMKPLPHWIDAFSHRYPKVEVKISHYWMDFIPEAIDKGEIDLGFTMLFEGERPPHMRCHPLLSDPSVVAMNAEHPLASRKSLHLADLKDQHFVTIHPALGSKALEWRKKLCRKRGFNMNIVQSFPSFMTLFMAVEAGVGIACYAQQVVEENASPRIHIVPIEDEDCRSEYGALWSKEVTNPNVDLFLQIMGVGLEH